MIGELGAFVPETGENLHIWIAPAYLLQARMMLADYYIGELAANEPGMEEKKSLASGTVMANGGTPVTLNPREKVPLKLMERIEVGASNCL